MTRGERERVSSKGRGATPKDSAGNGKVTIRLPFDLSRLAWLKKIKWKRIARVVFVLSVIVPVGVYWDEIAKDIDQKIVSIEVRGNLTFLNAGMLKSQLDRHLGEGFFALDLNAVRSEVEAMPWVYKAALRRHWPGTLMVSIEEQHPVAVWNHQNFLNPFGEVFRPTMIDRGQGLPELLGPEEKAVDVLKRYVKYKERLSAENIALNELKLEARGAWQVTLQDDVVLKLGRDPLDEKLGRFIEVYRQGLHSKYDEIESVDARYTNGIAVRWKKEQEAQANKVGTI